MPRCPPVDHTFNKPIYIVNPTSQATHESKDDLAVQCTLYIMLYPLVIYPGCRLSIAGEVVHEAFAKVSNWR